MAKNDPMHRILVIDDNRGVRDVLSLLLRERGHKVEVAADGEEAIALLGMDRSFDLVITDIHMPLTDGNEVARYIRSSSNPGVSLVAMTVFPDEIERDLFDYSIQKPFKLETIDKIITALGPRNVGAE